MLQATKQSLATHTGLVERVNEKIDSEEILQVLDPEQRIMTGEGGRYLEEVEDLACYGTASLDSILWVVCLQSLVCGQGATIQAQGYRGLSEAFGYNQLAMAESSQSVHRRSAGVNSTNKWSQFSVQCSARDSDSSRTMWTRRFLLTSPMYAAPSVRLVQQLETTGWRTSVGVYREWYINTYNLLFLFAPSHKQETYKESLTGCEEEED